MRIARWAALLAFVLAGGFAVGIHVGAMTSGQAVVVGDITQIQLLQLNPCVRTCPDPQPSTTAFALPGGAAVVTVPANSRAVVTVEPENALVGNAGTQPFGWCPAGTRPAAWLQANIRIDGVPSGPTWPMANGWLPFTLWRSGVLNPGRHQVAVTAVCPPGTGNATDTYTVYPNSTLRLERIKI